MNFIGVPLKTGEQVTLTFWGDWGQQPSPLVSMRDVRLADMND